MKRFMDEYELMEIRDHEEWIPAAARWFSEKWSIPIEAYEESMRDSLSGAGPVPRWYVVLREGNIIAGAGVIENDFHDRKDLTPNLCALYVEEPYRKRGIAGNLLAYICEEYEKAGVDTLYLITDHTSFYERYGWEYLCMVQGDGEEEMSRLYVHRM